MEINVVGSYLVACEVASKIASNRDLANIDVDDERGSIVLVSSVAGFEGQLGQTAYATSKGAIRGLVLPLARDLVPWGIRVNAIAPGVFETAMSQYLNKTARIKLEQQLEFPKRFGNAGEFAALAVCLIQNKMMNGEIVRLDGATRLGKL
ncbi:uncharacterized protein V1516DRAFT_679234 [Lipomyces oligophaga]|uniref:uncharacterized protein n=1 Tax=Lipomyces oligophaga TaxID=45792 RepID=UPI0034CD52D1